MSQNMELDTGDLVTCGRCQGNGEIVTDWGRYMKGDPGDKGDEAVTECPDCGGAGRISRLATAPAGDVVPSNVLGDENDLHSVAHALDIGGIGTPYRAYQGSLYCDYQPHRIADFQDYGLALAASVLFNNAKAIKAALAAPTPSPQTSPATEGELVHVDGVTMTPTAAANRIAELEAERDKLREAADNAMNAYVDALVKREHGGIAASIFLAEIAVALGRNPTAEMDAKRREAIKAVQ